MNHQVITVAELLASFPHDRYTEVLPNQAEAFAAIAKHNGVLTLEAPTASGKTGVGYTFLNALRRRGEKGALMFIAPNKTIVTQVQAGVAEYFQQHPPVAASASAKSGS